jgi:HAD superfamily hydrolase (TIGR01509 family)
MTRYDLVIFDCDGVLIDSEAQGAQALAEAVTAAGGALTPHEAEQMFCGSSQDQTHVLLTQMGLAAEVILRDAVQRLSVMFAQNVQQVPGMQDLITNLGAQTCVASNSSIQRLAESLGRTTLAPLFGGHIYSAEYVSYGKPAPDLALYCLAQMRTRAERAIFIDDNIHGVVCARAAGILAVGFVGPSEQRADHAETLRQAGADHVVHGVTELKALLSGLLAPALISAV